MRAQKIHMGPLKWSTTKMLGRSMFRLLADSERTDDVAVIEEIMSQAQLHYLLESGALNSPEGQDLMRDRPELSKMDLNVLRSLAPNTFGRAVVEFLDRYGFKPLDYPTPLTSDPDAAYLLRRMRMSHDLWHTLLGLGIEEHEEVLVHSFSLAQTGFPSSIGIIVFGAIKHMVMENRWSVLTKDLWGAYERGKRAQSLLPIYWERYWDVPLNELRLRFGVAPMT